MGHGRSSSSTSLSFLSNIPRSLYTHYFLAAAARDIQLETMLYSWDADTRTNSQVEPVSSCVSYICKANRRHNHPFNITVQLRTDLIPAGRPMRSHSESILYIGKLMIGG